MTNERRNATSNAGNETKSRAREENEQKKRRAISVEEKPPI